MFFSLYNFFIQQAKAAIFGGFLLFLIIVTHFYYPFHESLHVFDFLFLSAVLFQICLIFLKKESKREFLIIILFHILAMIMEIFKTSSAIEAWNYTGVDSSFFKIGNVPLFTGFMYSAVGSYIVRSFQYLKLDFVPWPSSRALGLISFFIYINFFSHHYIFDFRYIILFLIFLFTFKTRVYFKIKNHVYWMPFYLAGGLTAFFIWIAENIGTITSLWRYPNQEDFWQLVSFSKIVSWFLLLVMSFFLVSLIKRKK